MSDTRPIHYRYISCAIQIPIHHRCIVDTCVFKAAANTHLPTQQYTFDTAYRIRISPPHLVPSCQLPPCHSIYLPCAPRASRRSSFSSLESGSRLGARVRAGAGRITLPPPLIHVSDMYRNVLIAQKVAGESTQGARIRYTWIHGNTCVIHVSLPIHCNTLEYSCIVNPPRETGGYMRNTYVIHVNTVYL